MKPNTMKMKCAMTFHSPLIQMNADILHLLNFLKCQTLKYIFTNVLHQLQIKKIQDLLHYKINSYHNLLFNTRLDRDHRNG